MLSDDTHFCLAICLYPLMMETPTDCLAEAEAQRIMQGRTAIKSPQEAVMHLSMGIERIDCVLETFHFLSASPQQVKHYLHRIVQCLEVDKQNSSGHSK